MLILRALGSGIVKSLARSELPWDSEIFIASFQSHDIKQLRFGIIGRRIPIGGASNAGANICTVHGWNSVRQYWASRRIDTFSPVQFLYEGSCVKKFSIGAIENIEKSISISMHEQVTRRAIFFRVHQHRSLCGVVVVKIVRRELKVPFQFA